MLPGPFDHRRYVPVILTRQGERLALRELSQPIKAAITPLFVVHPIDLDAETRVPKRTVEVHLSKLAGQLANDWGTRPAFVDLRYIDTARAMSDGSHAVAKLVQTAMDRGLPLAPVLSGAHSAAYRAAAVDAANVFGTAVGIRLGPTEWPNLGTPLGDGHLQGLLAETGRPMQEVHLILDLEDQVMSAAAMSAAALRPALRALPHAEDWASLTVAGSGMPTGTTEVGRDGSKELPRTEWALWRLLNDTDYRQPAFGDYCVQHPDPLSDFDPRYMDSSAQLRYTIAASWFVVRGRGMKTAGARQIHSLAQQVVAHREYAGPNFSWGDAWLRDCAEESGGPGSQGVWRKVTTNHHLTYVTTQLANLLGP
jgi:hypothetical protein